MRDRNAEDGHDCVPDELRDEAVVALDHELHLREITRQHVPQRLGVEDLAEPGRSADVREEDRDDLSGLHPDRIIGHGAILSELSRG
jgi:hypothetical protein